MADEPLFISDTHLRLTAIDGMIQQWHRGRMTEDQAFRAVRAYVFDDLWTDLADG